MKWVIPATCAALLGCAGCRSDSARRAAPEEPGTDGFAREDRAALVFSQAVLLKPRQATPAADLAFTLAPLLVEEVADSAGMAACVPPTVYFQPGAVQIGGSQRLQMTYLWRCGEGQTPDRGVRLTLDSRGLPVIWERLRRRPGPRVVFVAHSLEERARAAFGAAVAGRRFAVEQPADVAPDVVVARVIEDGPAAMGPIVHQTAGGEINAVICRCMPTQAQQLVATKYYDLQPALMLPPAAMRWLHPKPDLRVALRLPRDF